MNYSGYNRSEPCRSGIVAITSFYDSSESSANLLFSQVKQSTSEFIFLCTYANTMHGIASTCSSAGHPQTDLRSKQKNRRNVDAPPTMNLTVTGTETQKYSVNQHLIETLLACVKSREIAVPEIQRPFVWDASKVRDLLDSLYKGYPVGYIIVWKNPNVRLKDGSISSGKKVLIDGQQRVTALTASLLGKQVVNKEYKPVNIVIAFNPHKESFEFSNPAIRKDKAWIPDIAPLMQG